MKYVLFYEQKWTEFISLQQIHYVILDSLIFHSSNKYTFQFLHYIKLIQQRQSLSKSTRILHLNIYANGSFLLRHRQLVASYPFPVPRSAFNKAYKRLIKNQQDVSQSCLVHRLYSAAFNSMYSLTNNSNR